MLLLGAWQGERISLRAVTQHPPSALETELAASTLMAATTLRFIDELMLDLPQSPLLPSAACSSSRLLPTTSAISAICARWSPTLRAIAATAPPLRTLLVMLPQPLMPVSRPPVTCQNGVHLPKSLVLRLLNVRVISHRTVRLRLVAGTD